jgi:hypothetical protein
MEPRSRPSSTPPLGCSAPTRAAPARAAPSRAACRLAGLAALVALGVVGGSGPALALRRPPFSPPVPPPPPAAPERVTHLSAEIDFDALPVGNIPAPLTDAERPSRLPAGDATGVRLVPPPPPSRPGFAPPKRDANPRPIDKPTSVKIEVTGRGPALIHLGNSHLTMGRDTASVLCDPRSSRALLAVHWETFSLDARGEATWTLGDGWFDAKRCAIGGERQTVLKPRPILMSGAHPLAFVLRSTEGLVVVLPGADNLIADAMTGAPKITRGTIARMVLPLARGGSATAAATEPTSRAATFLAAAAGQPVASVELGPGPIMVRIDATQTVSEPHPTLLASARVPIQG